MISKSLRLLWLPVALTLVASCTKAKEEKAHQLEDVTPRSELAAPVPEATPGPTRAASAPMASPPAAEPPKTIRIVTWNLEWFPGHKPEATPEAAAQHMEVAKAALAGLNPDVVFLEEVRDWESAAELCKAVPGLQVHAASRFQPRPQNQIVASKFSADSAWSESWQAGGTTPPRGYVFAAIELPDHRFLLSYALHLKSNLGDLAPDIAMRQDAVKQLLKHIPEMQATYSKRGPVALVVAGDMNTSLDDPKFAYDQSLKALIKSGFYWTHEGVPFAERTSIPGKSGFADNCFDHIFTAGLGNPVAHVHSFPGISDHNPVVLDVDLSKAGFQPKINPAAGIAILVPPNIPPPAAVTGTIDATDSAALAAAVGKMVTVKGRVQKISATKSNSIHFIDFAGAAKGGFVGIVKQDKFDAINAAFPPDLSAALVGKTVELKGEIVLFKDAPQIVVSTPGQIKVTDR